MPVNRNFPGLVLAGMQDRCRCAVNASYHDASRPEKLATQAVGFTRLVPRSEAQRDWREAWRPAGLRDVISDEGFVVVLLRGKDWVVFAGDSCGIASAVCKLPVGSG